MSIRPHPTKGPGWWQIRISKGRKQTPDYYTFQGLEAEALAFEAELYDKPIADSSATVVDLSAAFFDWYALHKSPNSAAANKYAFKNLLKHLGKKYLRLLRQHDYNNYKAARIADGVTKKTINNELTCLGSYLTWCAEEKKLPIGERPKLFPKNQTRPQRKSTPLTVEEIIQLIEQLEGDKKTIVQLYACSGLRRTEALHLKVRDVDLNTGLLTVTGKGNKTRIVPIIGDGLKTGLATAINEKIPAEKTGEPRSKAQDDHLFLCTRTGKPYRDIKKGIKAAAERAQIKKDVWNHLLRHSFGTSAIQAGIGVRSLQEMLGHGDIRMTEIYTHMSAQILTAEASKLDTLHQTSIISINKNKEKAGDND